jgi:hypothetical protein
MQSKTNGPPCVLRLQCLAELLYLMVQLSKIHANSSTPRSCKSLTLALAFKYRGSTIISYQSPPESTLATLLILMRASRGIPVAGTNTHATMPPTQVRADAGTLLTRGFRPSLASESADQRFLEVSGCMTSVSHPPHLGRLENQH